MEISLESKIEGLLFYKGEDVSVKKLSELLNVSEPEIEDGLVKLEKSLENRGLVLVRKDNSVVLGITKELSKASLETLSIVLYKNGVSRSEIDYIRGVNSSFILRNLIVRGLVEKMLDVNDSRRILYRPSFNTLSYMGVNSIEQLPNYKEIVTQLQESINQNKDNE